MRLGRMSEMFDSMPEYETHVTVRCADAAELARLDAWAGARELKVTHILLARGRMVSQPMLTLPDRTGHERLVPRLRSAGFDPVRVKVETAPWTTESPGAVWSCPGRRRGYPGARSSWTSSSTNSSRRRRSRPMSRGASAGGHA